jgi:Thoeris protein ThsB, TIR-like domain
MSGRQVFFSFHYENDIWRATNVRNAGKVDATAAAGWDDASLWEKVKKQGDSAIQKLIDDGLEGTTVTAVLIGSETASRPWVTYEIEKSIERGNGLLGVRIHGIKDQHGARSRRGKVPAALKTGNYRIYDWSRSGFGRWVEHAALDAGGRCMSHDRKGCITCRWFWWW